MSPEAATQFLSCQSLEIYVDCGLTFSDSRSYSNQLKIFLVLFKALCNGALFLGDYEGAFLIAEAEREKVRHRGIGAENMVFFVKNC